MNDAVRARVLEGIWCRVFVWWIWNSVLIGEGMKLERSVMLAGYMCFGGGILGG
ncbi:hypothetical protein [Bartonella sp. CL71SXKL]|uniref:hypothetical protein n=1 Tax=Bartonella sp. CL71SXKL TaxID=3243540 RepID=UPI0035CE9A08